MRENQVRFAGMQQEAETVEITITAAFRAFLMLVDKAEPWDEHFSYESWLTATIRELAETLTASNCLDTDWVDYSIKKGILNPND